jgi:hypothetical protein
MKKYALPERHPFIKKMLDAQNNLPDDWSDTENDFYCLSQCVSEEIAIMGKTKFIAFLFIETKSNLARCLLLSSPRIYKNLSYLELIEILHLVKDDDLACYHFIPFLYNYFGIDVWQLKDSVKTAAAYRYCCVQFSPSKQKAILSEISIDRINQMKKENAPLLMC